MDVLNKSGLQTQISYIKGYVNSQMPTTFVGSGSTAAAGLVPAPDTTAGTTKYLREDGTWQVPESAGGGSNDEPLTNAEIVEVWENYFHPSVSLYNYADQHITNRSSVTTLPDENIAELTNITLGANASLAFWYCFALTSLSDVEQTWNTSNVTDMSRMFISCQQLSTLDTSNWDTGNVTTMASMFEDCTALTSIGGISDWDVSNVQTMESMFRNCINLRSLDLSGWETNSLTNMGYMFYNFSQYIRSLDLSNFNTDNVVNMDNLFNTSSYTSLYDIDLSGWNTTNVESMVNMFGDSNSGSSSSIRHIIIDTPTFQFPLTNNIYLHNYCKILVPQALIATYQVDTYWSEHASKFDAIENYTITRSNGQITATPISA